MNPAASLQLCTETKHSSEHGGIQRLQRHPKRDSRCSHEGNKGAGGLLSNFSLGVRRQGLSESSSIAVNFAQQEGKLSFKM